MDESLFELTYRLSRAWTRSDKIFYEYRWEKSEKVVAFGGVDLEGRVTLRTCDRANSTSFASWLSLVAERYGDHHTIYVFLDNASYHSLIRVPGQAQAPKIRLVYIPRYAPDCNPAEELWKIMKHELGYTYFGSGEELKRAVASFDGQVMPNILRKTREKQKATGKGKN